jgi:hypothetical protein
MTAGSRYATAAAAEKDRRVSDSYVTSVMGSGTGRWKGVDDATPPRSGRSQTISGAINSGIAPDYISSGGSASGSSKNNNFSVVGSRSTMADRSAASSSGSYVDPQYKKQHDPQLWQNQQGGRSGSGSIGEDATRPRQESAMPVNVVSGTAQTKTSRFGLLQGSYLRTKSATDAAKTDRNASIGSRIVAQQQLQAGGDSDTPSKPMESVPVNKPSRTVSAPASGGSGISGFLSSLSGMAAGRRGSAVERNISSSSYAEAPGNSNSNSGRGMSDGGSYSLSQRRKS